MAVRREKVRLVFDADISQARREIQVLRLDLENLIDGQRAAVRYRGRLQEPDRDAPWSLRAEPLLWEGDQA